MDNSSKAFFSLLRAGLWEQSVQILEFEPLDFDLLYKLADEQAVTGLIAAGLEHVKDRRVTKNEAIRFLKTVFSLEARNSEMNGFIEKIIGLLRRSGVYALLVKGQGVAQCYERPLWRSSGDIDLLLDLENYRKAKAQLSIIADSIHQEVKYNRHLGLLINSWTLELHGTLRSGLSSRIDSCTDKVQESCLRDGQVRTWRNGSIDVFLPSANNDIIFSFTHFLMHFYKGGLGFRQICDWCRLLWTYRDTVDVALLKKRLQEMKLMSEWKSFASLAVDYLGMPIEAMPLYSNSKVWSRKARRICCFILKVGNFGQNRDMSYYKKFPFLVRKTISLGRRCGDLIRHFTIFPIDSFRFFPNILINGLISAARGE